MYINEIENFLWKLYKNNNKKIRLLDIYFSKLFEEKNDITSQISMLFAFLLSISIRLGHVCIPINKIMCRNFFYKEILDFLNYFFKKKISINKCINILYNKNIISSSFLNICTPFILYKKCIYMHKFWIYESNVINFMKKNFFIENYINKKKLFKIIDFFKKNNIDLYQQISILNVFFNKISIISGAPGTGKTTIIAKLILILYKIYKFNNKSSIKILSFTGKSSSCITNYLNKIYSDLKVDKKFKNILPDKSITIYKFLGFNYNNFIKVNKYNNIKILIIDESSMIDLFTLFYIFSFLKNNFIKIIFIGDSNQIGSIEPGSFFNEICNYNYSLFYRKKKLLDILLYLNYDIYKLNLNLNKLNNNISFLIKNYRFLKNKYLNKISNLINFGYFKKIDKFIDKYNFKCNFNFYETKYFDFNFILKFCLNSYKKYINFIKKEFNFKFLLNYFNKFKIITVLKNTIFGIKYINEYINNYILKKKYTKDIVFDYKNNCYNYFGKPILITKNNNYLKLFNGDSGFFIFLKKELNILFFKSINNYKIFYYNNISYWDSNWAITVHKSQGSEFDHILLILPNYFSSLLNRKLIYTAFTRAKKKVSIYSDRDIFLNSIKKKQTNFNNFIERLK